MTDFIITSDNGGPPDPSYWVMRRTLSTPPSSNIVQYEINTFNNPLPLEFEKDLEALLIKYLKP